MIIDTHCHLNDPSAFPQVEAEIEAARASGVTRMIVVGVKPDEWTGTVDLAVAHPELFCILGWHPNYTEAYDRSKLSLLKNLLTNEKVLALGEIGLDYHHKFSPADVQERALIDQLELAEEMDLPVVFHAREAYSPLLDLLERRSRRPYLFHCFTGSLDEASRAVRLGAFFGVDGPISYKNAIVLRDVIRTLPLDKLVAETDAPYMAPIPFRGKPNRPAYVKQVVAALAETLGIGEEECARITTENAARFFGQALVS